MNAGKASGFTLLELLIAMTILGFMMTLLFGALRLSGRSWDAGERRAGHVTHAALLQAFLWRELRLIHPFRWKNQVDAALAFRGEADRLRFVAPIAAQAGGGGLFLLALELERTPGKDSRRLILKRALPQPVSKDFAALEQAEQVVLAEEISALNLSYFGPDDKSADPQWQDRWTDRKRLPYLIRLRLKFDNGRDGTDLVVAPLIGQESGCVWDARLARCVEASP